MFLGRVFRGGFPKVFSEGFFRGVSRRVFSEKTFFWEGLFQRVCSHDPISPSVFYLSVKLQKQIYRKMFTAFVLHD